MNASVDATCFHCGEALPAHAPSVDIDGTPRTVSGLLSTPLSLAASQRVQKPATTVAAGITIISQATGLRRQGLWVFSCVIRTVRRTVSPL